MRFYVYDLALEYIRALREPIRILRQHCPEEADQLQSAANSTTTNTATGNGFTGVVTIHTTDSSASYTIVVPTADLAITKDDGVTSVTAGGSTTYTITVTNNGPDELSNATVVDSAPAGMTFGNWTCTVTNPGSGGSVTTACGAASGAGDLNTAVNMKNGAVITYSVPASIAATSPPSVST